MEMSAVPEKKNSDQEVRTTALVDNGPRVRSFVLRSGRTTAAQRRALEQLWPEYGIQYTPQRVDLDDAFGRIASRILEIGFGNGDALIDQARRHPDQDFIGIEVHQAGVGYGLLQAKKYKLQNLRMIRHDALEVLERQIDDSSISAINLFFPDPWPKKRHHKRRLVQPRFMALVEAKLEPGGLFHVVTDWTDYAEHIEAIVAANTRLVPLAGPYPDRIRTRFEARGRGRGHPILEQVYRRDADVPKALEKEYK